MEPKSVKEVRDVDYELEVESKLASGQEVTARNEKELHYLISFLLRRDYAREKEFKVLRKRLQHLETERSRNGDKGGRRTQKSGTSRPSSRGREFSDGSRKKSNAPKSDASRRNSKAVRFGDRSKASNDNKSQISKNSKSNKSRNGQTTRIRVWKLLPEDEKKRLRKEEDLAYRKVPLEKWQAMAPIEKTIVSKERKQRIQQFQEKVTAIAIKMAEKKAAEKMNLKAELAGKLMEEGKGNVSPPKNLSQKPPTMGLGYKPPMGMSATTPKANASYTKQGNN